ncbi:hypothetical protein GWI33_010427 [Rhynchophorus ferrugineus]|uniref:DUF4772 domain-containing protein n=1 Tax=Rhynchophorus ferrugineus TaxID=354439 RepID=A0A834M948_RHYFE|nr:hypothetical protein GWI33_010427 [Rhynchophorus ferrugineus]
MSTGKRIAKRSIIGTRVCAPVQDGKYYSGVIQAVKTPAHIEPQSNCLNLTPDTRYTVRFDSRQGNVGGTTVEYFEADLIGPGFHSVVGTELVRNQKCFVTFNGREVCGEVMTHHVETDEVIIRIHPSGTEEYAFDGSIIKSMQWPCSRSKKTGSSALNGAIITWDRSACTEPPP